MEITPKKILFGKDATNQLLAGVEHLANAVSVTMGPSGLNVVIEEPGCVPVLTKDGVTVAKAVELPDRFQNLGCKLVKQAASGAAEIAGDGTTTSTVLAYNLFLNGLRAIEAGNNPVKVRKGILDAADSVIKKLNQSAKPITTTEEIIQVGTISANGERSIGEFLAKAMDAVGRDGLITVEEAKGFKTSLQTVEGTRLDRGYISPYFINDQGRGAVKYDKPYILLANRKFSMLKEIVPLLEQIHQSGKPLLIIADEVEGEALNGIVVNNVNNVLKCAVIRAPEFGSGRVQSMEDLAFLLNTKVYTDADTNFAKLQLSDLGTCEKLQITKSETMLIGTPQSKDKVEEYCTKINTALSEPGLTDDEKGILYRRLNRLSGGVAILKVGGSTEAELRERKDRVEDALYATRAAVKSGILPGGGTALLKSVSQTDKQDSSYRAGWQVMMDACSSPITQICKNAGQIPELIVQKVSNDDGNFNLGYDAREGQMVDMVESGIIDPTLVVVSAVRHASSAADNLLSVACAMHNIEDEIVENSFKTISQ